MHTHPCIYNVMLTTLVSLTEFLILGEASGLNEMASLPSDKCKRHSTTDQGDPQIDTGKPVYAVLNGINVIVRFCSFNCFLKQSPVLITEVHTNSSYRFITKAIMKLSIP